VAEITTGVIWIAVVLGAVGSFLVGWLWYSPILFGKKWAEGNGLGSDDASGMPFAAMGANFIGLFLMSWFVGVTAVSSALLTVILATVAFTVLAFSGGMFAKKPTSVLVIDAGYWLAAFVVMFIFQMIF